MLVYLLTTNIAIEISHEKKWFSIVMLVYLLMTNMLLLKMATYSEFSHETWWFSIVMLVYLVMTNIAIEISPEK